MNNSSTTQTALAGILKYSPALLLISMVLSFVLVAVVQVFYYSNFVFTQKVGTQGIAFGMGLGVAIMVQLSRVAFGVNGAFEFAEGNLFKGIFGVMCSLGLTAWSTFEMSEIATKWSNGDPNLLDALHLVLYFLVWVGFVLELRLAVTIYKKPEEQEEEKTEAIKEDQLPPPTRGYDSAFLQYLEDKMRRESENEELALQNGQRDHTKK